MNFKYSIIIILISSNLFSQNMKKIDITGIAENSKVGAIVITKNNEVYYLEGIQAWNANIIKKSIVVEGNLVIEYQDERMLMNDKGEYIQGVKGEIRKILKPVWKLLIQTSENDHILVELKKILPKNWSLKIENEKLVITCSEMVYSLFENKINALNNNETSLQKEERFKKYGKRINPQFVFELKNKLSEKDINKIKSENNKINTAIAELQKKLKEIPMSRKDGNYLPRNKDEERIVADYEKERSNLESKWMELPDYQTEKHALYLESEIGIETEYISIFPEKYSVEMIKIKNEMFEKLFVKIK